MRCCKRSGDYCSVDRRLGIVGRSQQGLGKSCKRGLGFGHAEGTKSQMTILLCPCFPAPCLLLRARKQRSKMASERKEGEEVKELRIKARPPHRRVWVTGKLIGGRLGPGAERQPWFGADWAVCSLTVTSQLPAGALLSPHE